MIYIWFKWPKGEIENDIIEAGPEWDRIPSKFWTREDGWQNYRERPDINNASSMTDLLSSCNDWPYTAHVIDEKEAFIITL